MSVWDDRRRCECASPEDTRLAAALNIESRGQAISGPCEPNREGLSGRRVLEKAT